MANTPTEQSAKTNRASSYIDAAAIMRIKNLELRAKVVVEGFYNGLHRSPFHGFSVEFSEYRPYVVGDDPRYVDWKLWARSDRYYIKQFEDETNRRCHLVVDLSKSMQYGSIEYAKIDYARTLAATFAYYLLLQRDNTGLFTFDESVIDYLPARYRPGHFRRLLSFLERKPQGTGTDLARPLNQVVQLVKKRGLVLLLSDVLTPVENLEKSFRYLRARGHDVMLLRVLDPAEVDFSFSQPTMFQDIESGRNLFIDPAEAKHEYVERFSKHEAQLKLLCDQLGIDFFTVRTDDPLDRALFDLLVAQIRRGRQVAVGKSSSGGAVSA